MKLNQQQLDAAKGYQSSKNNVAILSRAGTGKCVGFDTLITMFDGTLKPVQDIKQGDLLMGPDSLPREVLSTTVGYGQMYWVRQTKGIDYRVNADHVLALTHSGTTSKEKYDGHKLEVSVKDWYSLSVSDKKNYKGYKVSVDMPAQKVAMDPYLLGVWLGDGVTSKGNIHNPDPEILEYLRGYAEQENRKISDWDRPGCRELSIWGLKVDLNNLGVLNNKHIPQEYLSNSRGNRLQLLAGLLDTDGYCERNSFEITQKNKTLAFQIKFLADSLGFRTNIVVKTATIKSTGFSGQYYRLMISGNVNTIPTKVARKQAQPHGQVKSWQRTGIKIEPDKLDNYYGFELTGDGLFLLEDMTVTHNTSLLLALNKIRKSSNALYLAFTNATKDELIKRDPSLAPKVKTTYSIGMKACGRFIEGKLEVNKFKYEGLLEDELIKDDFMALCLVNGVDSKAYRNRNVKQDLISSVNICLLNLKFTLEEIENTLKTTFTINPEVESKLIFEVIKAGLYESLDGVIGFVDMVSFPFSPFVSEEDLQVLFDHYPVVMVDEAQDLSMAQIKIVEQLSKGGQLVCVGDRNQSIMGFAGATGNSFDYLVSSFNCDVYPMDLCYRCPMEVLDKAREIVPDIRGLDRSGLVEEILGIEEGLELVKKFHKKETIICSRVNSKLVSLALYLLEEDIPFNFHRNTIEQKLKGRIAGIKESTPFQNLGASLQAQKKEYEQKRNQYQLDLIECLLVILKHSGATKYSEIYSFMRRLFFKRSAKLLLGTVHSFKGNEAQNVIAWGIEEFPHRLAVTESELEQEENLLYVLYTRAKENLYLVETSA